MARILLIESASDERAGLAASLQQEPHQVILASTAREGVRLAGDRRPDLILLDWTPSDLSGTSACRAVKGGADLRHIPLIVLGTALSEVDRVVAFELGADDIVLRPFGTRELMLRVKALLRRTRSDPNPEEPADFGRLTIQRSEQRLWVDEREVALTRKEFQLLLALYDRRGKARSREILLREVWRRSGNETRTLDAHVTNLREKLGPAGDYIETVRGVGYRFADAPDGGPRHRLGPTSAEALAIESGSAPYRLLVIDPDPHWRAQVHDALAGSRSSLHQAAFGAAGLREAERAHPQVILIDDALPDLSPTDVCRQLRSRPGTARAIIILTSTREDPLRRIVALELGADDYLVKPISVRELGLRIDNRIRDRFPERGASPAPEPARPLRERCRLGALELDREAHQAFVAGAPVPVSASELRLLLHLYDRRGAVSTREDIAAAVWKRHLRGASRAVDTLVKRLRQRLGPAGALIETVRGAGYRMTARSEAAEQLYPTAAFLPQPNANEVTQ